MPLNFGYIGVGKETARGTAVAPTVFFRATAPAQVRTRTNLYEVPGIDAFGAVGIMPTSRSGEGQFEVAVQPQSIGHLLTALLGTPNTTGSAPNFTHTWTPKTAFPTYTVESQDGVAVHRLVGAAMSRLELSHTADGILMASTDWVGMERTTAGTASTPTYETQFYTIGQVGVTVDGASLGARARSVRLTLDFPKGARHTLGQITAAEIDPTGDASVEAQLELIADPADTARLAQFQNASTFPVALSWAIDANTSLSISFVAAFREDPIVTTTRDKSLAMIQWTLRAIRTGASLVTVTAKNQQASY